MFPVLKPLQITFLPYSSVMMVPYLMFLFLHLVDSRLLPFIPGMSSRSCANSNPVFLQLLILFLKFSSRSALAFLLNLSHIQVSGSSRSLFRCPNVHALSCPVTTDPLPLAVLLLRSLNVCYILALNTFSS